ncbi:hypothetical protein RKD54_002480 [Pseudarthrobacter sp. SLBN-100]
MTRAVRGGRVEGVFRVEDHRYVEGLHHLRHLFLAESHPQEVGRIAKVVTRLNDALPVASPLVVGHHGRHGSKQVNGFGHVGLARGIFGQGVPGAQHRGRRPAHVHGMGRLREYIDDLLDHRIQRTAGPLAGSELRQLLLAGQLTVPEQVGHLFKTALCGELLDGVAPVQQGVGVRVDLGD